MKYIEFSGNTTLCRFPPVFLKAMNRNADKKQYPQLSQPGGLPRSKSTTLANWYD